MSDESERCTLDAPRQPRAARRRREQLATWAKALGHPARMRIVEFLLAQDACVCGEIVAQLELAQSTVSQHLKVLAESGLISGTIKGPCRCYCVNPLALAALRDGLDALLPESLRNIP